MLSIATAALAFSAPVSKTVDSKVAAASAAAALSLIATPAFAGDAGAGEAVFSGNCAACHAGGQNVIMPEKTLEKAVRAIGQIFPRPDSPPRANMSYYTTSSPRRARAPPCVLAILGSTHSHLLLPLHPHPIYLRLSRSTSTAASTRRRS